MRLPALLLAACVGSLLDAPPAAGSGPAPPARAADVTAAERLASHSRLDPRLLSATLPGSEPVPVWVEFADKGEQGPADLAARLAAAERDLTPECRHRRERAHVSPLVDYLDLPLEPSYLRALEERGFALYGQSRWFSRVAVRTSGPALVSLGALPFVRRVAPVELAMPRRPEPVSALAPLDRPGPLASEQAMLTLYGRTYTQLARLNIPAVHDSGYIGTGVSVCLLDDGFNWYRKHEALKPIPVGVRTRDFIRGVVSVQDTLDHPSRFEHGTLTLSVLAGRKVNVYRGPAYGCSAILGRTEDESGEFRGEMVYWATGAEWADSIGADIISSSLGYKFFPPSEGGSIPYEELDGHTTVITRAAEIAAAKGILVVVSAGNDGSSSGANGKIGAPADANGDSVLAVGAVDSLGVRAGFSSRGPTYDGRIKPDLVAQGVATVCADNTGLLDEYVRVDGTSLSAPLVAGLAACLMQARPSWPPVWIIQALKRTASNAASPDTLVGWGIPNGLAALRFVPDTVVTLPPITGPLSIRLTGSNPLHVSGQPTRVRVALGTDAAPSSYRVRVFDAGGRFVRELASGALSPGGFAEFVWRGDDAHGRALVPGLYFLSLERADPGRGVPGRAGSLRVVVLR